MSRFSALPGNQQQTGGGGGSIQPGDVGTTELANGSVTRIKLSATGGSAGDQLIIKADSTLGWEAKGAPSANSVKVGQIDAGTATDNYVLAADSSETSGIDWKAVADILADASLTPAKFAGITTGSANAGKPIILDAANGTAFDVGEFPTFSIGAGDIDNSNMFTAGVVNAAAIGAGEVGISELDIDGTAGAGKILKAYLVGGVLKLQWADDNTGGGGGGVSLPINLAGGSSVVTGDLPVADGGTGASTAAGARANLGVAAASGGATQSDPGSLPYITNAAATPDDHAGRIDSSTADIPTGLTAGVLWEVGGRQAILETEGANAGALWDRSKTETNDSAWTTPANANATQITTIAAWRALGFDQVRESTLAAAHPQGTTADCAIVKVRGGFAGTGYFIAIVNGSTTPAFWWAAVPAGNSWEASALDWENWNSDPYPQWTGGSLDDYIYQDYRKIPAGRVGVVVALQISGDTIRDSLVAHGYASNSSTFTAYSYHGGNLQSSTIGRDVTAGSWALVKIDTDQMADEAVGEAQLDDDIVSQDGAGNPVVVAPVGDLHSASFPGYSVVSSSSQLGVGTGRIYFDYPNRRFFAAERTDVEHGLLADMLDRGFRINIVGTSAGATAKYTNGTLSNPVTLPGGLNGGVYRQDWGTSSAQFAAGDTVTINALPAYVNQNDELKTINMSGLTYGEGNRIVLTDPEGDGFAETEHITSEFIPTALADIEDINEALRVAQMIRGKTFGTTYSHSTQASGVTAGRIRWDETTRILTVHPLATDDTLAEYLSVLGVQIEATSSNGARLLGTIEAVVANPAGTPAGSYSVRIADTKQHYSGDIRSGTITLRTHGAFRGRDEDVINIANDAVGVNELNTASAGSTGQVLTRTAAGQDWQTPTGGGSPSGDAFDEDAYSSKAFGVTVDSLYDRRSSLTSMPAGSLYWDSSNSRMTIVPNSTDSDLTDFLVAGVIVDFRGASDTKLRSKISRVDNPSGTFPAGTFTVQLDSSHWSYVKSSGFDASTVDLSVHSLGKVLSLDTEGAATVPGGFGIVNLDFLDLASQPAAGQALGVSGTDLTGDRRIHPITLPTVPRSQKRFINIQASGDSLSISNTTMQTLRDGTGAYSLKMEIQNAADWVELISDGVVNCGSGSLQGVGVRLEWRFRTATSESGLTGATYEPADSQRRTFGLGDVAYQTKQAGGGSGGTSHRDLWVISNDWMSLSHISSVSNPTTAGRWIEFELRHALPDNAFSGSAISNRYGYIIRMTCIPNTDITDQS